MVLSTVAWARFQDFGNSETNVSTFLFLFAVVTIARKQQNCWREKGFNATLPPFLPYIVIYKIKIALAAEQSSKVYIHRKKDSSLCCEIECGNQMGALNGVVYASKMLF